MFSEIKKYLDSTRLKNFIEVQNIGLYIFGIIVLAIAWSGAKTVQNNFELQKKVTALKQQNTVLGLLNTNTGLQNKFYQTDEYLDISARQNLGLAAPGEKVLIVPKSVAMKYVDQTLIIQPQDTQASSKDDRPTYKKNLESWRDFLFGRGEVKN
jgi:cell division protein FtsB